MRIAFRAIPVAAVTGLAAAAIALTATPAAASGHTDDSATSLSAVWCTYTVNHPGGLGMHSKASSGSIFYTVPDRANVTAQVDITNGYRRSAYGSHSGYLSAAYLINKRACFE
jgi:hypothetical protein